MKEYSPLVFGQYQIAHQWKDNCHKSFDIVPAPLLQLSPDQTALNRGMRKIILYQSSHRHIVTEF